MCSYCRKKFWIVIPRRLPGCGRDRDHLLGFDCLVQAVLPLSPLHLPARRFIDDHDFIFDDDVVPVALKAQPRGEGLLDVLVHPLAVDAIQERRLGHQ